MGRANYKGHVQRDELAEGAGRSLRRDQERYWSLVSEESSLDYSQTPVEADGKCPITKLGPVPEKETGQAGGNEHEFPSWICPTPGS